MTRIRAAIRLFAATSDAVIPALDAILKREGRLPFPANRVPSTYPAEPGEFVRVWVAADGPSETVTLQPEAWRSAFARALALAKALPLLRLAAAVRPPDEELRVKAYAGGDLVLAVGPDYDEELFYRPRRADAEAVARLLTDWGLPAASAPAPDAVWHCFASGRIPCDEAPSGDLRLYARSASRLVLEN